MLKLVENKCEGMIRIIDIKGDFIIMTIVNMHLLENGPKKYIN